jgi:hypothetical protein
VYPLFMVGVALLVTAPTPTSDGPALLLDAYTTRPVAAPPSPATAELNEDRAIQLSFAHSPVAFDGRAVPGGGILVCEGRFNPASVNGAGQIAFGAALLGGSSTSAQLISQIGNLPGDANNDGQIDAADWAELPASLGRPDGCARRWKCTRKELWRRWRNVRSRSQFQLRMALTPSPGRAECSSLIRPERP